MAKKGPHRGIIAIGETVAPFARSKGGGFGGQRIPVPVLSPPYIAQAPDSRIFITPGEYPSIAGLTVTRRASGPNGAVIEDIQGLTFFNGGIEGEWLIYEEARAPFFISVQTPSNTINYDLPTYLVSDDWSAREGIVPADDASPRKVVGSTSVAPDGGRAWYYYIGTSPTGDLGSLTAMSGAGPYTFKTGQQTAGTQLYVRLALADSGTGAAAAWASDPRPIIISDVPAKLTAVQAATGTGATGDVIVNIGGDPNTSVQPTTKYQYSSNGGSSWSDLGAPTAGGVAADVGSRVINFGGSPPATVDLIFAAVSANGRGVPSDTVTVAPRPAATGAAPTISNVAFDGTDLFTCDLDQDGTIYWLFNQSATALSGATIKAAVFDETPATEGAIGPVTAGQTEQPINVNALTTGTWYLHLTAENSLGLFATDVPLAVSVTGVQTTPSLIRRFGIDGDGNYDTSKPVAMPFTPTVPTNRLIFYVSASAAGTGSGGAITVPAWWNEKYSANDGQADKRGKIIIFEATVQDWIDAGSPASFNVSSNSSCHMAFVMEEWEAVDGFLEAVSIPGADPAAIAPSLGNKAYGFSAVTTRHRSDSVLTAGPAGYSDLEGAASRNPGQNDDSHRTLWVASKVATAATEDPGAFTAGSPSGSGRLCFTVAIR